MLSLANSSPGRFCAVVLWLPPKEPKAEEAETLGITSPKAACFFLL
jgi:hypothetical protein